MNNYYIRTDVLNKTINEKLSLIETSQKFLSSDMNLTEGEGQIDEREEIYTNNKKKVMSYEGAQYRRVRKMAEQHY